MLAVLVPERTDAPWGQSLARPHCEAQRHSGPPDKPAGLAAGGGGHPSSVPAQNTSQGGVGGGLEASVTPAETHPGWEESGRVTRSCPTGCRGGLGGRGEGVGTSPAQPLSFLHHLGLYGSPLRWQRCHGDCVRHKVSLDHFPQSYFPLLESVRLSWLAYEHP